MKRELCKSLVALCAVLCLVCWKAEPAQAQYFKITDLGNLPIGPYVYAAGINDAGQIIGVNYNGNTDTYPADLHDAFLWDVAHGMTDLDTYFGYDVSSPICINNKGQVGIYTPALGLSYSQYLWTPTEPNGTMGSVVGAPFSMNSINDSGEVGGLDPYNLGPAIWTPSGVTDFPVPAWWPPDPENYGGPYYSVIALNNTGLALVYGDVTNEDEHVFDSATWLYVRATQQYTRIPGGSYLNDKGQIASMPINNKGWQAGGASFLRHGQTIDLTTRILNLDGWSGIAVNGINLKGQMCGTGTVAGVARAFILDPVLPAPLSDFHGDGANDIVFQNATTGQMAVWQLDVYNVGSGAYIYPPQWDTHWLCVGAADINQDGNSDLVFQNKTTGQLAVWYMQGRHQIAGAYIYPTQDPAWPCVSIHDLNADGQPDLIFQNKNTGQLAVWYMTPGAGNYLMKGAYIYPTQSASWRCIGSADFDGDGKTALVFQNKDTGSLMAWRMEGNYQQKAEVLPFAQSPAWKAVSLADYDGDGATDILFQNTATGQLAIWYMGGVASADGARIAPLQDLHWQVVGPH